MSYDLYLTSSGDITFEESNVIRDYGLVYDFFIASSNAFTLNIYTKTSKSAIQMPQSLTLEFYYYTLDHNKNSRYVEGDKFIQQAIKLRLSTEQGTITNDESFGSRLYSIMHSNLDDSKLLDAIVDIAKEALSDILPNANITASKIDTNYYDYHDTVKLTIKHDNKTYFYTL